MSLNTLSLASSTTILMSCTDALVASFSNELLLVLRQVNRSFFEAVSKQLFRRSDFYWKASAPSRQDFLRLQYFYFQMNVDLCASVTKVRMVSSAFANFQSIAPLSHLIEFQAAPGQEPQYLKSLQHLPQLVGIKAAGSFHPHNLTMNFYFQGRAAESAQRTSAAPCQALEDDNDDGFSSPKQRKKNTSNQVNGADHVLFFDGRTLYWNGSNGAMAHLQHVHLDRLMLSGSVELPETIKLMNFAVHDGQRISIPSSVESLEWESSFQQVDCKHSFPNLKSLRLAQPIMCVPSRIYSIMTPNLLKQLEKLELNFRFLDRHVPAQIMASLPEMAQLRVLTLSHLPKGAVFITPENLKVLDLSYFCDLEVLDLSRSALVDLSLHVKMTSSDNDSIWAKKVVPPAMHRLERLMLNSGARSRVNYVSLFLPDQWHTSNNTNNKLTNVDLRHFPDLDAGCLPGQIDHIQFNVTTTAIVCSVSGGRQLSLTKCTIKKDTASRHAKLVFKRLLTEVLAKTLRKPVEKKFFYDAMASLEALCARLNASNVQQDSLEQLTLVRDVKEFPFTEVISPIEPKTPSKTPLKKPCQKTTKKASK